MNDGVDERGLAGAGAAHDQDALVSKGGLLDERALAFAHDARGHIAGKREDFGCAFPNAKAWAFDHGRDQPLEAAAVERQLAFKDRIVAGDGGLVQGCDGGHGGFGPVRGHQT